MKHVRGVLSIGDFLNTTTSKIGVILLLVCAMSFMVSASVEVHNYSFQTSYFPFEMIDGEINISILGEDFDSLLTSSEDDSIVLGDFLTDNGVMGIATCSPPDCSNDYNVLTGSGDETFSVGNAPVYVGFELNGTNVNVTGLNFFIESDFHSSIIRPLSADFFEGEEWLFDEFSDTFADQRWGCYNGGARATGPLIGTSSYCEMIGISETGAVLVGATVGGTDDKNLTMVMYTESGGGPLGNCVYNPNNYDGCRIDADSSLVVFDEAKYQICVKADETTDYTIYTESSGLMCGFVYGYDPESSVEDFSIFARTAQYSDAGYLSSSDFDFDALASAADNLLVERYGRDCSDTCILPMAFSGLPQSLRIANIDLDYTLSGKVYQSNEIVNLQSIPASVDFEGILDLSLTGFNISGPGDYSLYLGGEQLFEEEIEQIPAPIITSLSPNNPPAGVPVTYYVAVDFDSPNASLTYTWSFENSTPEVTVDNSIVHTFTQIRNYSVIVEVSAGGNLTSKKGFIIGTVSPAEAVNATLTAQRKNLDNVQSKLAGFPSWYNEELEEIINYTYFDGELTRLERKYNTSYDDSDLLEIAADLFSLNFPTSVFVKGEAGFQTLTQMEDIDPQIILDFAGGSSSSDLDVYLDPILRWQTQTIESAVSTKEISVAWLDGSTDAIFRTYSYDVTSYSDDESYLIIKKPYRDLFFKKDSDPNARKVGEDNTVIVFDSKEHKVFEFYYKSTEETPFFVSPKLSKLVIVGDIIETCDFNLVCEEEFGEDYKTCPSDCKQPTSKLIFYLILVVVFALVFYTLLQIWYKRNYENHLFGDRRELYNILMFIANARARGNQDSDIRRNLSKQGWSHERLTYVFRKSRGKRTGMVEIIPIGKISAYMMNRKARAKIATSSQQQMGRNINKSRFQRRPIRR